MPGKTNDEEKVKQLKGEEAEEKVLQYMRQMNRPFGAVDVSANLKNAVSKPLTQKILVALAEKGEVTQKVYGKTTFFVANQDKLDAMPDSQFAQMSDQLKETQEEAKTLAAEVKSLQTELTKVKNTPTNAELPEQLASVQAEIDDTLARLVPLRSGTPLLSAEERKTFDDEWVKWRAEWIKRRKTAKTIWNLLTDNLPPPEADALEEDLGLEMDSQEHEELEHSPMCNIKGLLRC